MRGPGDFLTKFRKDFLHCVCNRYSPTFKGRVPRVSLFMHVHLVTRMWIFAAYYEGWRSAPVDKQLVRNDTPLGLKIRGGFQLSEFPLASIYGHS